MPKIDYIKVEESISQTLHTMFVKKLMEGDPSVSKRAVSYYGMGDGPRPKTEDPVISSLVEIREDIAKDLQEQERLAKEKLAQESLGAIAKDIPKEDTNTPDSLTNIAKSITESSQIESKKEEVEPEKFKVIEDNLVPITPLFLLRKHLTWLRRLKIRDKYELLGTTKEEIKTLRQKELLTEEDQKRVKELLKKAEELKISIIKNLGLEDDNTLIEKERKKQITKRFNVRPTWIPLQ